jgi:hypothetical protein
MCSSTLSLTSALDVVDGQRHAPAASPRERPGTHCISLQYILQFDIEAKNTSPLPQLDPLKPVK